jgi:polyisoprenoid-binding protein YceI
MIRCFYPLANRLEASEMITRNAARTISKKLPKLVGASALFLLICAGLQTSAAAEPPTTSAQKSDELRVLPTSGTYKIDPRHSFAYFSAWHHMVGRVRGRFDKVSGTITVAPDPANCSVDVTIDVATINTQVTQRDDDLRSDAYFDVKKFLTMTYQGRGIHRVGPDLWRMDGSLTMHGVTKVVPLTFKYSGVFSDPEPNQPARVAFHGTAATKRAEFGMGARDNKSEVGDSTVPDVDIEIDVEADAIPATP